MYWAIVHFDEKFREFIVSNQNLWMSILNYLDNFAVIIKMSAKNIVFQEILKNCLPLNWRTSPILVILQVLDSKIRAVQFQNRAVEYR